MDHWPASPNSSRRLQPRRRPLVAAMVSLIFVASACSDSGNAGEAITSSQPIPTATALTLGAPEQATATALPDTAATETITTDTTETTDAPAPATATAVIPATAVENTILADAAFTASSKITTAGLDEVFFGMTPEAAAASASTSWVGLPPTGSWPSCFAVTPSNGPDGISFWVNSGTIERVNISHPAIRTRSGFGVGTPLADLQNGIGEQLSVTDFGDGTQTAEFIPSDAGDAQFRIIFDLSGGEVFRFRSGRVGVVDQPENSCG